MTASHYLLQLIVNDKIVNEVIDQLLTFETLLKFNVEDINAYHASQQLGSTSEQVSGHVKRIKIEVQVSAENFRSVLNHAKAPQLYSEMEYVLIPVIELGIA